MDLNVYTCSGRLGNDPEMKFFDSGSSVCNFRMAVNTGKDRDGDDRPPIWLSVAVWGKRGETANDYLRKGSYITVTGQLAAPETFETRNGETGVRLSLNASSWHFGPKADGESSGSSSRSAPARRAPAPARRAEPADAYDDSDLPF